MEPAKKACRKVNIVREGNRIKIMRMDHPIVVSKFILAIGDIQKSGFKDCVIDISEVDKAYPDVLVPITGLIEYLRTIGFNTTFSNTVPDYLKKTSIESPISVSEDSNRLVNFCLDKVWKFENSQEISKLVDAYIDELSREVIFGKGVSEALSWSLYEVMDNVLQHAESNLGYVMAQIHSKTKRIAFCVFDAGQGIFNSLRSSIHAPRHLLDAITLAIQEGVTRDKKIGQGNGMWGLHRIIKANSGRLLITAHSACYIMEGDVVKTFDRLPLLSNKNGCTTVDFIVEFEKEISLPRALSGHEPINLRILKLEDDRGRIIYKLKDKATGTGTRESGTRMRNDIINIYNSSQKNVEIDFAGVAVISSSFADELLGKLVAGFGFSGFNQIFRLSNMNEVVAAITHRSVAQRMGENLNK